jgi:beta-lactamase regulating signal transducer with metallopeptidase domain
MMLSLLLDSALRSLLLGMVVWAMLKLARLCDTRTETAIWTAVLVAALSMPILSRYVPALPLTVPRFPDALPESVTALQMLTPYGASSPHGGDPSGHALAWLSRHGQTCLLGAYVLGVFGCLTRIATGLLLTVRLYRRAVPVDAAWAKGRNIRASAELKGPVSFAGSILLTADYEEWGAAKRDAVLAHEEAHVARGDFFIQLAALIHCALFWFSPFAWWLQRKLAQIAETASDEAAILRLNDRITYAEILVEVCRCAQQTPLIAGMAKGPLIQQRVEHILSETPNQNLSLPLRVLTVAALATLALAVAAAKAVAVSPMAVAERGRAVTAGAMRPLPIPPVKRAPNSTGAPNFRSAHPVHAAADMARTHDDDTTYNPRALLDPVYAPKPNHVPPSTVVHAGRALYIRSTERPVTEVAETSADRRAYQIH